ncbi:MAG TPA: RidA family protein [Beutenbergiaceae bacterium]|nr:RidA family protein [Beutenbergiaceae bacterium]
MSVQQRLGELGVTLPEVAVPVANYVPAIRSGNYIYTSGQLPLVDGALAATGQLGPQSSVDDAAAAARVCALNAIAAAAGVAGGVDHLARAVKVTGFVSSSADFFSHPQVVNGASDLLAEVFGPPHARSAVGVAALPLNASVEVEVIFELV